MQLRDFSNFPAHDVGKRLTSQHQHGIARNNQHFEPTANRVPDPTVLSKPEVYLLPSSPSAPSPVVATTNYRQLLPHHHRGVITDYHRSPLITTDHHWPPLATTGHRWPPARTIAICPPSRGSGFSSIRNRTASIPSGATILAPRRDRKLTTARDDDTWWTNTKYGIRSTEHGIGTGTEAGGTGLLYRHRVSYACRTSSPPNPRRCKAN